MKNKFLQYTLLGLSLVFLFSACRKDSFKGTQTNESGKTFIYIEQAQERNQFFDVFTDVKPVLMFTVRRDAASKADLQKAVTVTLKAQDQSYVGTTYTVMPSSLYTLNAQPGVSIASNGDLTLNFAAGDFAKNIIFNVDGSKVDLSKQYAMAYVITNFGGFTKQHAADGTAQDTILSTIAIKNRWDGVYTAVGTQSDVTDSRIQDVNSVLAANGIDPPMQYELQTTSATSNYVFDNYVGGEYSWWAQFADSNGAPQLNRYGSFSPVFTFDPATNKVVSIVNKYGQPAGNGRSAELDPSGDNVYDPGTKTIKVKFFMKQPGASGPSGPVPADGIRTRFDYTLTYIGSR